MGHVAVRRAVTGSRAGLRRRTRVVERVPVRRRSSTSTTKRDRRARLPPHPLATTAPQAARAADEGPRVAGIGGLCELPLRGRLAVGEMSGWCKEAEAPFARARHRAPGGAANRKAGNQGLTRVSSGTDAVVVAGRRRCVGASGQGVASASVRDGCQGGAASEPERNVDCRASSSVARRDPQAGDCAHRARRHALPRWLLP